MKTRIPSSKPPTVPPIANALPSTPTGSEYVQTNEPFDFWKNPAVISPNNFVHKSLSNWAFNPVMGCAHGCLFCYVPSAATIKRGPDLAKHGVRDPDLEWGEYVLVRPWNEKLFLASLLRAERTPVDELNPDGNRAIIFSSTTDAYQVIRHRDPSRQRELTAALRYDVTRALELIRDHSTLNVRFLTRSPLARQDFELFKSFGPRLLFGMSLPTLNNNLARIYEPNAPAPTQRLATLRAAKAAGLHVYVAIAPTYPECDERDLRATLLAVRELEPVTIFHEPINIRAENVERIKTHALELGVHLRTEVFATPEAWADYALTSLFTVQRLAKEMGMSRKLKLWPDQDLEASRVIERQPYPKKYAAWLQREWAKISRWPKR